MNGSAWSESLFWRLRLSPRALRVWSAVLLLAPLAWIGGLALRYQIARTTWPQTMLDRQTALSKATSEARRLGFDTTGWTASFDLRTDDRVEQSMKDLTPSMRHWVLQNVPPRGFDAGFRDPHTKARINLFVSPRGTVTGFRSDIAAQSACAANDAAEEPLARAVFARRFAQWPQLSAQTPDVSHIQTDLGAKRTRFAWRVNVPDWNEQDLRLEVETACGRVVGDQLELDRPHKKGAKWHAARESGDPALGYVLVTLYFCVAIPWIAVRYVKRTVQGEAPQGRILLAGAIFAAATALALYDKTSGMHIGNIDVPLPLMILIVGFGIALVAALFGMAYAAAEGEVRELYPGTMTALDALLTGRWATRNAGASALIGMALGGWLLLATQIASLLQSRRPVDTSDIEFAFAQVPWLSAMLKAPHQAVMTGVFGFLVPLALFHRRAPRRLLWLRSRMLVFTATAIGFAATAPSNLMTMGCAIWGLACALCLFAAFDLANDLLAGLAALAALRMGLAAGVLAAATPGYTDLAVLLGAALATAAAAAWAARYGRVVRDEEVRPVYATNLAERLRLEQEIDATRVAQQRLLPAALPQIAGLNAAAECVPARVVAGDFYDAYSIGAGRLAVLLAEGGGQRLARALSIALVKGYLMQKSAAGRSPGELLAALHTSVGHLVAGSTSNLCYAIVDPLARTLRYARTGDWPAILLRRTPDSPATPCAESTRMAGSLTIYEGAASLEAGSLLLLYTDGVAQRGALVRSLRRERFERAGTPMSAAQIVASVMERIGKRQRRHLRDDLTLVAVRVEETTPSVRQGVA